MFSNSNSKLPARLVMHDGTTLDGALTLGTNATLQALLAYNSPFLEMIMRDGSKRFVSKTHIAMIEPREELQKPVLEPKLNAENDPYHILGINRGSDFAAIRKTYLDLAKKYHPDKVAQVALPIEVLKYMSEMFRQVNSAFMLIKSELNVQEREEAA